MSENAYLIYLIAVIIGSIGGLLFSYKQHGEAFIYNKVDILALVIAILGWILLINFKLLIFILNPIISISVGLFLIAFVIGMRPGYGRYETVLGIIISALIYGINYLLL
jgi:energy-converting hydrogenase A subunit L